MKGQAPYINGLLPIPNPIYHRIPSGTSADRGILNLPISLSIHLPKDIAGIDDAVWSIGEAVPGYLGFNMDLS